MKPDDELQLDTAFVGKRVLMFNRLDSTNTFALALADDPANDGLVVIADEQTAGRGQHGRSWTCPGGAGVLLSVLLFPPASLRRPVIMTALATVAICELIQKATRLQAAIKWPNDVMINGRKVAGVLIEQRGGVVIGIGLNVNQLEEHFVQAGLTNATSLAVSTGRNWVARDLSKSLIEVLDAQYSELLSGSLVNLESLWRSRLSPLGTWVEIETATEKHRGVLSSLGFDALTLESANGSFSQFSPERVRLLQVLDPDRPKS